MQIDNTSNGSASWLQMPSGMKCSLVAILATCALVGCGVGVDEAAAAQEAAGANRSSLEEVPATTPLPGTSTNPRHSGTPDAGSDVALPQDPIPLLVGHALPISAPLGTSSPEGLGLPPLPPR